MKSYFFKTKNGFTLHYQVVENILPATTVFLHGNVASNRWWIPTEEIYTKNSIGKNYTGDMISIEFLGCGKSDAPRKPEDMDLIQFASDFNDILTEFKNKCQKCIENFNVVGHSTGGFIAAIMTSLNPELFSKSLLLNPVGAKGLPLTGVVKAAYEKMVTNKSLMTAAIGAAIYKNNFDSDFFKQVIAEDAIASVQKISYWVVQAFSVMDATEVISRSTVPTLILFGEHDRILTAADSQDLAYKYLQKGRFELVRNQGHSMNVENPEAFVEKVSNFLFSN